MMAQDHLLEHCRYAGVGLSRWGTIRAQGLNIHRERTGRGVPDRLRLTVGGRVTALASRGSVSESVAHAAKQGEVRLGHGSLTQSVYGDELAPHESPNVDTNMTV